MDEDIKKLLEESYRTGFLDAVKEIEKMFKNIKKELSDKWEINQYLLFDNY